MRIRILFSKTEAMRYTSHLDLYKTLERTARRANLPLAYTQGFRTHPRISLASALPLGFTSDGEVVDIWLDGELSLEIIERRISDASPPGILIKQIESILPNLPSLQSSLKAAEYLIITLEYIQDLDVQIYRIMNTATLPRTRRGKGYNLRPLIYKIEQLTTDPESSQNILIQLAALDGATGRPEEVIMELGGNPNTCRVHRTRLIFEGNGLNN